MAVIKLGVLNLVRISGNKETRDVVIKTKIGAFLAPKITKLIEEKQTFPFMSSTEPSTNRSSPPIKKPSSEPSIA